MLDSPTAIKNVKDDELDLIRSLWDTWKRKQPRNLLRSVYYDGKAPLKDLGISLPPSLRNVETVIGWPEKAVRALAQRNIWDGFVTPGADLDPFGLADILDANRFDIELPQAITSAYKHSCSFITTTIGDVQSGEPEVLIMARSAEWSSAIWDKRRRMVKAALAITDTDKEGRPSEFTVYLPDVVLSVVKKPSGWAADRRTNPLGEVLVEPLTYDPQLDRPFGRSRITRAVMTLTDKAVRTLLRAEGNAEFYTSPAYMLLGVDPDAYGGIDKWKAIMGRMFALSKDEDGDVPKVQQMQQATMQPHFDMLRMLAAQFAGETGLPLSSLGIVQDNPSSAEAIYAAKEDLVVEALNSNRVFGSALERVAQKAVRLRDGMTDMPVELRRIQAKWRNPSFPSPISAAQAMQLEASVIPWIADTEVALERFGHDQAEITRLMSDRRRTQGPSILDRLAANRVTGDDAN